MSNSKISALTSATTPLAGTEVLPIVQSGSTVKVANNDLRPKQIQSNATSGVLQIAGPAAASTRVMTVPDSNFTAARTDAAQSFTGDQTLSTGNLVIGTSGKGIDFSATPGTGTSELLADYEEGTWFPAYQGSVSNPTVAYAEQYGYYTQVGNVVTFTLRLVTSSVSGGSGDLRVTLPFTTKNSSGGIAGGGSVNFGFAFVINPVTIFVSSNVSYLVMKVTPADLSNLQTSILNNVCYLSVAGYFFV